MATLNIAPLFENLARAEVYTEIWIAEDSADVRIFLRRAFDRLDPSPNLIFFRNGAELVEHFQLHSSRPKLVLLDMEMPVMNGLATLGYLRASKSASRTPAVIFSSLEDPEVIRKAYSAGAKLYLKKPARLQGFSDVAQLCISYADVIAALPPGRLPRTAFEAKEFLQLFLGGLSPESMSGSARAA